MDALAFVLGLGIAWWFGWSTTDLVWSLWLSSLVVGYAIIVWNVTAPMRDMLAGVSHGRGNVSGAGEAGLVAIFGVGTLFMLAFFTVHFGGFHYGHSVFLNGFFPVDPHHRGFPTWATYREVVSRYWWFVPVAAIAERQAFRRKPAPAVSDNPVVEAFQARANRNQSMMEPYRNVVRMHLLIFFFFFAHFTHIDGFIVYAIAYAAYFFPWRLLKREKAPEEAAATETVGR